MPAPLLSGFSTTPSPVEEWQLFTLGLSGNGLYAEELVDVYFNGVPTGNITVITNGHTISTLVGGHAAGSYLVYVETTQGNSNSLTVTIGSPTPPATPTITSLDPPSVASGGGQFTLTVNGTGYLSAYSPTVYFDGYPMETFRVSDLQLTCTVPAVRIGLPNSSVPVIVRLTGNVDSAPFTFVVSSGSVPNAVLDSIGPDGLADTDPIVVTLTGSNFAQNAEVWLDLGRPLYVVHVPSSYDSPTSLHATISHANRTAYGTFLTNSIGLYVFNPGSTTETATRTMTLGAGPLSITGFDPATAVQGTSGFTLHIFGTGFVNGCGMRWNTVLHTVTFYNSTHISVPIVGGDLLSAGNPWIQVGNPDHVTVESLAFVITNPVPTLTSISPTSVQSQTVGDVTLTINGDHFVGGTGRSRVRLIDAENPGPGGKFFRASDTMTTWQFTISIGASTGINFHPNNPKTITVVNDGPGGGESAPQTLSITGGAPIIRSISYGATPTSPDGDMIINQWFVAIPTTPDPSLVGSSVGRVYRTQLEDTTTYKLRIVGANFNAANLRVHWVTSSGDIELTVDSVNPGGTELYVTIPVSDRRLPGTIEIYVKTALGESHERDAYPEDAGNPGGDPRHYRFWVAAIIFPPPSISTILPTSKVPGSSSFTLNVSGDGSSFQDGLSSPYTPTKVLWSGQELNTVGSIHRGSVPAGMLGNAYIAATVPDHFCDLPEGTTRDIVLKSPVSPWQTSPVNSSPALFYIQTGNPVPTISALVPDHKSQTEMGGDVSFVLRIEGTGFIKPHRNEAGVDVPGSQVYWGLLLKTVNYSGVDDPVSNLKITITRDELGSTRRTVQVKVVNGPPGGGPSLTSPFEVYVDNPAPTIAYLDPSSEPQGTTGPITLSIHGANFVASTTVVFDGTSKAVTHTSSTLISVQLVTEDFNLARDAAVVVTNPAPGGGSVTAVFHVNPSSFVPTPSIDYNGLSPTHVEEDSGDTTISITGRNFISTSVVLFSGTPLDTTPGDGEHLTAVIPASLLTTVGTFYVVVFNPTP